MTCEHSTHGNCASANGSAKPEARTRGAAYLPVEPQLVHQHVERHAAIRQGADDAARSAADVQHRAFAGDQLGDVSMPAALPVSLQRDRAVVGAEIVVGGGDRVAKLPQRQERAQVGARERHVRFRSDVGTGPVVHRDLEHPPAGGVRADERLLEHVVVRGFEQERADDVGAEQPDGARSVVDTEAEPAAERQVQQSAAERP